MMFFWKIVSNWVYFGQGEGFKLTTELSEKCRDMHLSVSSPRRGGGGGSGIGWGF